MRMAVSNPNNGIRERIQEIVNEYDEIMENDDLYGVERPDKVYVYDYFEDLKDCSLIEYKYVVSLLYADAYRILHYTRNNEDEFGEEEERLYDMLSNINSWDDLSEQICLEPDLLMSLLEENLEYSYQTEELRGKRFLLSSIKDINQKIKGISPQIIFDEIEAFYPYTINEINMIYDDLCSEHDIRTANGAFKETVFEILIILIDTDMNNYQDLFNTLFDDYYKYTKYVNRDLDPYDIEPIEFELIAYYEQDIDISLRSSIDREFLLEIVCGFIDYKMSAADYDKINKYLEQINVKKKIKK